MDTVRPATPTIPVSPSSIGFSPARVLEIELSHPLPDIPLTIATNGNPYHKAQCLLRLHTYPLCVIELTMANGQISAQQLAQQIWQAAHQQINAHLREDGLQGIHTLESHGIQKTILPLCRQQREQFLTTAPFVSVVVATRDRPGQIQRCVDMLLSMYYPNFEIIVVDNAPTSTATRDVVQERYLGVSRVRYVCETQPGLSAARNRGIQEASGEFIAITDDDVQVDAYWLLELVRGFQVSEQIVCVTGLVLPLELETIEQRWFAEYGGYSKGFVRRLFNKREHRPDLPLFPYTAGKFGTGANLALRAEFIRNMGGFDTTLGTGTKALGGEDLALFFQIIHKGYTLLYTPYALLYHPDRRDYSGLCKQMYSYGAGLTAYLTRILLNHPLLLFDLLSKLPYGLYFALNAHSPKNSLKSSDYPRELTKIELQGMWYGPRGCLHSLREQRRQRKKHHSHEA